jgi:hypothetical protein
MFEILYDRAISLCYEKIKSGTQFETPAINNWALRHYAKSQILNTYKMCEPRGKNVYSLRAIFEELISHKDAFNLSELTNIYSLFDSECEKFKKICNTNKKGHINIQIFITIEKLLNSSNNSIKSPRHKTIAHSATKLSRIDITDEDLKTSIPKINDAIDNILVVYSFFNNFLDSGYLKFDLLLSNWESAFIGCVRLPI